MIISHINRTRPDCVYAIFQNKDTVTLTDGMAVIHNTANADGLGVKRSSTGESSLWAGVVAGIDIPPGAFGTIQIYGFHAAVKATVLSGISTGTYLVIGTTTANFNDWAVDYGAIFAVAMSAVSGGTCKAFIRAM